MDRTQFISRCVVFSKQGDKVSLIDLHNPDATAHTYEPWLGLVVSLADGQHTIAELIEYLSGHYREGSPEQLGETIESAVERLAETGTIRLTGDSVQLPYYLSEPAERLDVPRALHLMVEDGHTEEQDDSNLKQ